jgi:hypothetical protein
MQAIGNHVFMEVEARESFQMGNEENYIRNFEAITLATRLNNKHCTSQRVTRLLLGRCPARSAFCVRCSGLHARLWI